MVRAAFGERDAKDAENVVVRSSNGGAGFDERLPFSDQRAEFAGREIQAVKTAQAILAYASQLIGSVRALETRSMQTLHFVDTELHLHKAVVFVFLEIGKTGFEHTAFERVICGLGASRSIAKRFASTN